MWLAYCYHRVLLCAAQCLLLCSTVCVSAPSPLYHTTGCVSTLFYNYFLIILLITMLDKHIIVCYTVDDVVLLHTLCVLALCSVCSVLSFFVSYIIIVVLLFSSSVCLFSCLFVSLLSLSLCCWLRRAACLFTTRHHFHYTILLASCQPLIKKKFFIFFRKNLLTHHAHCGTMKVREYTTTTT